MGWSTRVRSVTHSHTAARAPLEGRGLYDRPHTWHVVCEDTLLPLPFELWNLKKKKWNVISFSQFFCYLTVLRTSTWTTTDAWSYWLQRSPSPEQRHASTSGTTAAKARRARTPSTNIMVMVVVWCLFRVLDWSWGVCLLNSSTWEKGQVVSSWNNAKSSPQCPIPSVVMKKSLRGPLSAIERDRRCAVLCSGVAAYSSAGTMGCGGCVRGDAVWCFFLFSTCDDRWQSRVNFESSRKTFNIER